MNAAVCHVVQKVVGLEGGLGVKGMVAGRGQDGNGVQVWILFDPDERRPDEGRPDEGPAFPGRDPIKDPSS